MSNHKLSIINEHGKAVPEDELQRLMLEICAAEAGNRLFDISLLFCNEIQMAKFNRLYRGKKGSTDVLSFVTAELPYQDGSTELMLLVCDIVIDINQIEKQKGHDGFQAELIRVCIHGLLHLLGYDHIRESDRIIMKDKEINYIRKYIGEC